MYKVPFFNPAASKPAIGWDFDDFVTYSLIQLQQSPTLAPKAQQWQLFCTELKKTAVFSSKGEKLMLLQALMPALNAPFENKDLAQLLVVVTELKIISGSLLFEMLFGADVLNTEKSIALYLSIVQLLLELHESPKLSSCMSKKLPNLKVLLNMLQEMHRQELARRYPLRDSLDVVNAFANKSDCVEFPLERDEMLFLQTLYDAIKQISNTLTHLTNQEIKEQAVQAAIELRYKPSQYSLKMLISCLSEGLRRTHGIVLYDTQFFAILGLLNHKVGTKGRIAQIRTGEGKSNILAILHAFMALQGFRGFLVTSNECLAARDAEKYESFFQLLGLTVAAVSSAKTYQEAFQADVVYATNTELEFPLMFEGLYPQKKITYFKQDGILLPRPMDYVINDEVDNLFFELADDSAILSVPGEDDSLLMIYQPILEFAKKQEKMIPSPSSELVHSLREVLNKNSDANTHKIIEGLSDRQLSAWLTVAGSAYFEKTPDEDYVVNAPADKVQLKSSQLPIEIIAYDGDGRPATGCIWPGGMYQFLLVKHGFPVTRESLTAASMSHPSYFNLFPRIMGVTGTMGGAVEREEIQKIYGVQSFDVPPHFPRNRTTLAPFIAKTTLLQQDYLLSEINIISKKNRPILVLVRTIKESKVLCEFLQKNGIKPQVLNAVQPEAEDYLIARAGSKGMLTIATNAAGRGTDILLSEETKQAGGLHVIFTFFPTNLRVQEQGFGRAARQGAPGSHQMVLSLEEKSVLNLLHQYALRKKGQEDLALLKTQEPLDQAYVLKILENMREKSILKASQQRLACSEIEKEHFIDLSDFFKIMKRIDMCFENTRFQERMINNCKYIRSSTIPLSSWLAKQKEGKALMVTAISLLRHQQKGGEVDWSSFIEQFKGAYFDGVRFLWAKYYHQKHGKIMPGLAFHPTEILVLNYDIESTINLDLSNLMQVSYRVMVQLEEQSMPLTGHDEEHSGVAIAYN